MVARCCEKVLEVYWEINLSQSFLYDAQGKVLGDRSSDLRIQAPTKIWSDGLSLSGVSSTSTQRPFWAATRVVQSCSIDAGCLVAPTVTGGMTLFR